VPDRGSTDPTDPSDDPRFDAQEAVDPDLEHRGRDARRKPDGFLVLLVAVGGMTGSLGRYGVSRLMHVAPGSFPIATFTVNVMGSFILGALVGLLLRRPQARVRAFVGVGVLGGYTTFSTYMVETAVLLKDGHVGTAVAYVAVSVLAGVLAAWCGLAAVHALPRRSPC
jgi:fluoride exporter